MAELIYPELSYKIMGIIYEVFNELGHGYQEKYYQKAIALRFKKNQIDYAEQLKVDLSFDGQVIGEYFLDFLVENKIVLELKIGDYFYKKDFEQVKGYLKAKKLELGIIVLFTKQGVKSKRILHRHSDVLG